MNKRSNGASGGVLSGHPGDLSIISLPPVPLVSSKIFQLDSNYFQNFYSEFELGTQLY